MLASAEGGGGAWDPGMMETVPSDQLHANG